jgi:hypothetical protein
MWQLEEIRNQLLSAAGNAGKLHHYRGPMKYGLSFHHFSEHWILALP